MTNDTGETRRNAWLERLAGEFLKLDLLFPREANLLAFQNDNDPAWVAKLTDEFARILMPAADLRGAEKLTPKRMGAVLGHQCANGVWMMEWFEAQIGTTADAEGKAESDAEMKSVKAFFDALANWYSGLRRLAKRSLCCSIDQSYEDMSSFLDGFADGFRRKPRTFNIGQFGSTNFEIYLLLLTFHRFVGRLDSVSELHAWLRKVMGEYRTGDLKRIEKICQRIGLHFRKPGRPKAVR